jgi:hypothetical protein
MLSADVGSLGKLKPRASQGWWELLRFRSDHRHARDLGSTESGGGEILCLVQMARVLLSIKRAIKC